jgi:hypothetical protein
MWRERGSFGPSPASRKVQALARDKNGDSLMRRIVTAESRADSETG